MRIAVVGTGVSGLVCAHLLHRRHDITVFEADDRIGGHVNTVRVDLADETHEVDTGFIVHNRTTYPNFVRLLDELGVATQPSEMSFSVTDDVTGMSYRGTNLDTLFAQRANALNPRFLRMIGDIGRFNRRLRRGLVDGRLSDDTSVEDLIAPGSYGSWFRDRYLVPLGSAIWSADPTTFTAFPAASYARFMSNHGLLRPSDAIRWRTVTGGSARYVEALTAPFAHRIRLGTPVDKIVRRDRPGGRELELRTRSGGPEAFDAVILATHSDQALNLLADATPAEHETLGSLRYRANTAVLHTDARLLPPVPRARASWNARVARAGRTPSLTYWMNRLQSIESREQLLVTLNGDDEIDADRVLARFDYAHPVFDRAAMTAQRRRSEIQGRHGTYYAGAYWGYGFHEDGVNSALDVCRLLGGPR
jgi:predicted NAD/FAD-binding protein